MSDHFGGGNPVIKRAGFGIYILQWTMVFILSAGWWGILYPDFSMTEDVVSVEEDTSGDSGNQKDRSRTELFFDMLEAEPGQIHVKSRLLETICGIRGNNDGSDKGSDKGSKENAGAMSDGTVSGYAEAEEHTAEKRCSHRGV